MTRRRTAVTANDREKKYGARPTHAAHTSGRESWFPTTHDRVALRPRSRDCTGAHYEQPPRSGGADRQGADRHSGNRHGHGMSMAATVIATRALATPWRRRHTGLPARAAFTAPWLSSQRRRVGPDETRR